MMSTRKCDFCKGMFDKCDWVEHIKVCKFATKKYDPAAFTAESSETKYMASMSKTIPDTVFAPTSKKMSKILEATLESDVDPLLSGMLSGMSTSEKKPTPKRGSGVETSILSAVAADEGLAEEYKSLATDKTGKAILTAEFAKITTETSMHQVRKVVDMSIKAQNISLCFLLDTTGSMGSYITGVKDQILEIVSQVTLSGCEISGISFVGYKDWCDGDNHFEILPFTKDFAAFGCFVKSINPTGGGDFPEDVLGGIEKAIGLVWPEGSLTRIIFHMGDAPPHGKGKYHDHTDQFPGGHSRDPKLSDLFRNMAQKNIIYTFGKINRECDKMLSIFEKTENYGKKIDVSDTKTPESISRSVMSSVEASVSATSSEVVSKASIGRGSKREYVLCPDEPDWSSLPKLSGSIVTYKLPEVEDIKKFVKLEQTYKGCTLSIANQPFSKGSVRLAFYGKMYYYSSEKLSTKSSDSATEIEDNVVFKEMINVATIRDLDRQRYMVDLEVQTVASKFAFEFNDRISRISPCPNIKLKYLMAKVVRIDLLDGSKRFVAQEKKFRGLDEMVKYTNNMSYVKSHVGLETLYVTLLELALCFQHFSHDYSEGYLMISDIQGVDTTDDKGKVTLLLTDPAIHCPTHARFGKTNLGEAGIRAFYKTHKCNKFCNALGLSVPT